MTYRSLKRRFDLDDEYLEDLKGELIKAEGVAADEDGDVLVWIGGATKSEPSKPPASSDPRPKTLDARPTDGERRQLTVMFIDLVGSTTLSQQLDAEDYHARVIAYQSACHQVIAHYEGHIAQYLGDGVLVYFGYPTAHEDDAVRAVRSGLEIVTAVRQLAYTPPLQVRIGIHTGPVVISEIGAGEHTEKLALGETPNIAARLQGLAEPDTVVISAATQQLVEGLFESQDLGPHTLKGISTPLSMYQVVKESATQSRFEIAVSKGLTPLVGREEELGLLRRRWEQAKDGAGQVVLLSGEPGIGKSRLVQVLKEQVSAEGATRIEFRCSPYHQNSALYPIIDHLQRLLRFAREDSPQEKLRKLEMGVLPQTRGLSPLSRPLLIDPIPLLAALLSLPHPAGYPPITISPQKQKEKTQEALVAWLMEEAEQAAVYCAWEDLHWADPSTVEVLTLLLEQIPTARLFTILTFRPEFTPSWSSRSYLTQLTLSRLGRAHVEALVAQVTGGQTLPVEVVEQIRLKTDGVPLFVEELTKSILEAVGATHASPLQFAIPATLQDSLMARLDRLNAAKELAQLGATLGREFSYELLHAVSPLDEGGLQRGLRQLVEGELLYQRGLPPQATYLFKHALIQDTAYQSLLKSKRQQLHQQVAQVLETQFPEIKETQPELLAHHYTEAGLAGQAIPYWQRAGERASQRSAYVEATSHLTKGIELLTTLSDTPERAQQELSLQITLGNTLMTIKGFGAPEVGNVYRRARELCQQVGETPQLFPALWGLWLFHAGRGELQTARELGEQLFGLAQIVQDSAFLLEAHHALWATSFWRGELALARSHSKQGIALYDPLQHHSLAFLYGGHDPGGCCRNFGALTLWLLGYPDQALQSSHEALTLTRKVSHSFSLAEALGYASWLHEFRREEQAVQGRVEAVIVLSTEQGFPYWLVRGLVLRGWALVEQGQGEEGIAQMRRGLAAMQATGVELFRSYFLALLAEGYGKVGQPEEGLTVLAEALAFVKKAGERVWEAELYRLKGELTLKQFGVQSSEFLIPNP
ncbi:MAG: adenylate/guanylate cyclase domain-containing protein [Candidatus Binatia bacterium]